jgi:hypothetical protein
MKKLKYLIGRMSLQKDILIKGIRKSAVFGSWWLIAIMGAAFIVKYSMVDCSWWERMLFGFSVSFIITVIKTAIRNKDNKEIKVNSKVNTDNKDSKGNKDNNININNNNRMEKSENNLDNKIVKFIKKIILKFIQWFIIYLGVGYGFGYFSSIYCEPGDGVSNNSGA